MLCSITSLTIILSVTWGIKRLSLLFVPPIWRRNEDYYEDANRKSCYSGKILQYTFAHDNGINPEIEKAKNYVAHWEEMKSKAMGLLLWGDIGTGKSFFAGCVANALLDKGIPVLMTNFTKILNFLTGMYPQDRNEFINSLNQYSLLIIDDLGVERNSEFALEQVFHVIDSRYRSMKPMIITTNLTLEELKHPTDLAHSRIYDRILERCVPLKINNQNIRELNAAANMSEARKLLV